MQLEHLYQLGECSGRVNSVHGEQVYVSLYPDSFPKSEFVTLMYQEQFQGTGVQLREEAKFKVRVEKDETGRRLIVNSLDSLQ